MLFRSFLLLILFVSACHSPAKPLVTPFTKVLTKAGNCWIYHPDMRPDSGIVYSYCSCYSSAGRFTTYYFDKSGLKGSFTPPDGFNPFQGGWWYRESDHTFGLGDGEQDKESKIFHVLHYNQDTVFLHNSEGHQSFLVRRREGTGVLQSQAL